MYAQKDKVKENKTREVANSVTQKKSTGSQGFSFVDNRPQTIVQRQLQSLLNHKTANGNLNQVLQLRRDWKIIDNARKHYNDVWGEAMGIKSDADLKDEINTYGSYTLGDRTLAVDTYTVRENGYRKKKECKIGYDNKGYLDYDNDDDGYDDDGYMYTDAYHSGPSGPNLI